MSDIRAMRTLQLEAEERARRRNVRGLIAGVLVCALLAIGYAIQGVLAADSAADPPPRPRAQTCALVANRSAAEGYDWDQIYDLCMEDR